MGTTTGYFANTKRFTKVHLVENEIPVCGSKITALQYQKCSSGITLHLIECQKCKKIALEVDSIKKNIVTPIALFYNNVFTELFKRHLNENLPLKELYSDIISLWVLLRNDKSAFKRFKLKYGVKLINTIRQTAEKVKTRV